MPSWKHAQQGPSFSIADGERSDGSCFCSSCGGKHRQSQAGKYAERGRVLAAGCCMPERAAVTSNDILAQMRGYPVAARARIPGCSRQP
jgi:hypothetical protein